jgi:hypothetical protein
MSCSGDARAWLISSPSTGPSEVSGRPLKLVSAEISAAPSIPLRASRPSESRRPIADAGEDERADITDCEYALFNR